MNRIMLSLQRCLLGLTLVTAAGLAGSPALAQSGAIEGTWKLMSRTLPDGTTMKHPDVQAMMTFSNGYRNINGLFKLPDGSWGSFGALASYKLTPTEYTETLQFAVVNLQGGGKLPEYIVDAGTKSSPAVRQGRALSIQPPFDPPVWSFEGDKLTATLKDAWTDRWERVR